MLKENEKALLNSKLKPLLLVYAVMVILALVANFLNPGFLAISHMGAIFRQMAFLGIVCIGQTLVILTGGIDLSISYVLVLCNVVSAQIINGKNGNTLKAFMVCLLISIAVGVINSLGVHFLKIPAMIMTLAMGSALLGIAYIYCDGAPKGKTSPFLDFIANGKIGGVINGATLIWIVFSIIVIIAVKMTTFGRKLYAIGVNRESARYSGISVYSMTLIVYVASSVLAGICGFILLGYTGTSYLSTGASYNMDSIAAVVVGGTSTMGGSGSYVGTIAGVGIMIIINSLMTTLNMAESGKKMVQGLIIILLLVAVYGRKKKN